MDLVREAFANSFTILQRTSVNYSSMADVEEMTTDLTHVQNAFQRVVSKKLKLAWIYRGNLVYMLLIQPKGSERVRQEE